MDNATGQMSRIERPAGPWARIGAVVIDLIVIHLAMILIAIVAFPITGGAVRMTNPAIAEDCAPLAELPRGFEAIPIQGSANDESEFAPTRIDACRMGFGPFDTHRYAFIAEEWPGGRYFQRALDLDGGVTEPLIFLNDLHYAFVFLALFFVEWRFGTTIGKAALGLQIEALDGSHLKLKAAFIRNLVLWGPGALYATTKVAILWGSPFENYASILGDRGFVTLLIGLWPLALLVAWLIFKDTPPWDRVAKSRVVPHAPRT